MVLKALQDSSFYGSLTPSFVMALSCQSDIDKVCRKCQRYVAELGLRKFVKVANKRQFYYVLKAASVAPQRQNRVYTQNLAIM